MTIPEHFEETLFLALELIARIKTDADLSAEEHDHLHTNGAESESSQQAAVAFLHETLMTILLKQEPEAKIDLQKVAVDLIDTINDHGGVLRPFEVAALKLPKEWLDAFEAEGVIMRSMGGMTWGRNARRAVKMYREEQERKGGSS